jgi:enoyl-CoA hydratase/carnithine racemase
MQVEIGVGIPPPELELFKHAMPLPAFYQTVRPQLLSPIPYSPQPLTRGRPQVMSAKRWGAAEAAAAGLVLEACPPDDLVPRAMAFAEHEARLCKVRPARLPRLWAGPRTVGGPRVPR